MKLVDFQKPYKLPLLLLLIIAACRIFFLYYYDLNLYADEAQYYGWSKNLDFGYYSKPPMIAFVIRISTMIFGESEVGIRIFSPIFHLLTSVIVYHLGRKLYSKKIGYFSALIYTTLPAVTFSSNLITTDPILLFFWALTLLLFLSEKWIMAGISFGLGMMTKYSMIMFLPSAAIYLYLQHRNLNWLKNTNLYLSLFLGFAIFLPNIYWNIEHDLVSFSHIVTISQINKPALDFKKILEFLLTQIIIVGPILACLAIRLKKYHNHKYVTSFSLPILIFTSFLSLFFNAYGNWAAPVYIAFAIFISAYHNEKLLKLAIFSNLIIAILIYSSPLFVKFLPVDPYKRLYGWRDLGFCVSTLAKLHPSALIVSDDRKITAELTYYVGNEHREKIRKWNHFLIIKSHYDMIIPFKNIQPEMILVFKYNIPEEFNCTKVDHVNKLDIYYCTTKSIL
jgi:4-amino-4-deoxy-L-arabinose transferase-like glycosyltransferase